VNAARINDSTAFANGLIGAEAARVADSTLFAAHVANDFDNDSTNELQTISLNGTSDTILLSRGGGAIGLAGIGSRWQENAGNISRPLGRVSVGIATSNFGRFQITDVLTATGRSFRHDVSTPNAPGSYIGYDLFLEGTNGTKRGIQSVISGSTNFNQAGYFLSNGNAENVGLLGLSGSSLPQTGNSNYGLYGQAGNSTSENIGIQGRAMSTNGTFTNYGTYGTISGNANGAFNIGAYGEAVGAGSGENYGLISYAFSSTTANYAIYSEAPSNAFSYSGYFVGNVVVDGNLDITGSISKGSGTFKIDHPADPSNKYLVHSFVESPEMMNVYNGNITTDANGYATVELPDYFEMANKDFRYQLTVIGTFAQAIVKDKVKNNRFVIQTNQPNVEVSWQVTGIRDDNYSNANRIIPVQNKDERARGKYLHPEVYGQPKEMGERHKDMKVKPGLNTGPNVQAVQSEK
jgi:hypothetical protein